MRSLIGEFGFDKILSDELIVTAFDYNQQEPRFFSKYFDWVDPNIYDVKVSNATASSASAPFAFNPQRIMNGYGTDEYLVDGGIICNNPAYYAY